MVDRYRGPLLPPTVRPLAPPNVLVALAATLLLLLVSVVLLALGVPQPMPGLVAIVAAVLAIVNAARLVRWAVRRHG